MRGAFCKKSPGQGRLQMLLSRALALACALSAAAGGGGRRRSSLSIGFTFTRSDKCAYCEFVVEAAAARLRADPFLAFVGPPEDTPLDAASAGSVYGLRQRPMPARAHGAYPQPPRPRAHGAAPAVPPPPFVAPPSQRLPPSAVAAGAGTAQDAMVALTAATLRRAAESAARTFALPGANGATFEGGLASLGGTARPDVLAPVDPNELLASAAATVSTKKGEMYEDGEERASSVGQLSCNKTCCPLPPRSRRAPRRPPPPPPSSMSASPRSRFRHLRQRRLCPRI